MVGIPQSFVVAAAVTFLAIVTGHDVIVSINNNNQQNTDLYHDEGDEQRSSSASNYNKNPHGYVDTKQSKFFPIVRHQLDNRSRDSFARKLIGKARIIGGTNASANEYPSYAITAGSGSLCGGTLIWPDMLLTAAHCNPAWTKFAAINGTFIEGPFSNYLQVTKTYPHPKYNETTYDYDILLVKLNATSSLPQQAYNNDSAVPELNTDVTVIGYGLTSDTGNLAVDKTSKFLLKVGISVVNASECAADYSDFQSDRMICAGVLAGGKDSCQGDSGSPLMITSNKLQVGLVSYGDVCGAVGFAAVYTRVSFHRKFIRDTICNASSVKPTDCNETVPTPTTPTTPTVTKAPTKKPVTSPTKAPRTPRPIKTPEPTTQFDKIRKSAGGVILGLIAQGVIDNIRSNIFNRNDGMGMGMGMGMRQRQRRKRNRKQ